MALVYANRGIARLTRKQNLHDLAIADFDQAIVRNPKLAEAFNNRCRAQAIAGRLAEALRDCTKPSS